MKKAFLILVAGIAMAVGTASAQNTNGQIGRARGAAHDCLSNYTGPDWEVWASVSSSICFVSGEFTSIDFVARPTANPCPDPESENCHPPALPIIIANVQFGCDGEIVAVNCY